MKGSIRLDYLEVQEKGFELLHNPKTKTLGLYIICSINLGLRVADTRHLRFEQLRSETFTIVESKTRKERTLKPNRHVKRAVSMFDNRDIEIAFLSQKGRPYSSQQLNRLLKKHFITDKGVVSTHSLRKTFGYQIFLNSGESERSLIWLSSMFNHSNISTTRIYLGIHQDELNNMYDSL